MPRSPRRSGPWLATAWLVGTIAAVAVSVVAVNLAGAQVTTRPIAEVSRSGVVQALAGDATVLSRDDGNEVAAQVDPAAGVTDGTDAQGRSTTGGSGSADRAASDGSSGSDDGGGSGGGPGSGGGSGGSGDSTPPGDSGTPTTTEHEHDATTTTTTATPSSPVSRTVSGNTVTIRCTGDSIALVSTTAATGFTKKIDKTGPQQIRVQFTNAQTEADIEIEAECSHGVVDWG